MAITRKFIQVVYYLFIERYIIKSKNVKNIYTP